VQIVGSSKLNPPSKQQVATQSSTGKPIFAIGSMSPLVVRGLARVIIIAATGVMAWFTVGPLGRFPVRLPGREESMCPRQYWQGKLLYRRHLVHVRAMLAPYVQALLLRGISGSVLQFCTSFGLALNHRFGAIHIR